MVSLTVTTEVQYEGAKRNDIGSRQNFRAKLDLGAGGDFEFRAKINEIHTQFGGFETDIRS